MKHLHMLMAVITLIIFAYQALQVFSGKSGRLSKGLMIATHIIYTILVVTGLMVLLPILKFIAFPHWLIAKIVLLVVAISATIKATRPTVQNNQAKAGIFVALIAYIGILSLAFIKPMNLF